MDIFEFNKSLLVRLEESLNVLSWQNDSVPASGVFAEWSYFIEVQIEPTGWQALWKIPRTICEELHLNFPTIAFGMVEQVLFKDLKAIFKISYVEGDEVQLPSERQEVNLHDLFPTKNQENTELNIEKTADSIDALRFFYNHIWMPWDNDNDDDIDWAEKHLESRIRFHYDLKSGNMKRSLANRIKTLLLEAQDIQERRALIETDLNTDNEEDEVFVPNESKKSETAKDLINLHLRLNVIKNEMDMLENPEMRVLFEENVSNNMGRKNQTELNSEDQKNENRNNASVYLITKPMTLHQQINYLYKAQEIIDKEKVVQLCMSLQHALNTSNASDDIIVSTDKHSIRFLESLEGNGSITGLGTETEDISAIIKSNADESTLFVINGDYRLKNLTIDCNNVRTGILIKNGNVTIENCHIFGNENSSTNQGILISGTANVTFSNCVIEKFCTGIVMNDKSVISMNKSSIRNCHIGVKLRDGNTMKFENVEIYDSKSSAIYFETKNFNNNINDKKVIINSFPEIEKTLSCTIPWNDNCLFKNNTDGNIIIINMLKFKLPSFLDDSVLSLESPPTKINKVEILNESTEIWSVNSDSFIMVEDSSICESSD